MKLQYCSFFRSTCFLWWYITWQFIVIWFDCLSPKLFVCLRNGLTWWMPCDGGGSILLLLKGQTLWLQGHCAGVRTVQSYKQGPGSGPVGGTEGEGLFLRDSSCFLCRHDSVIVIIIILRGYRLHDVYRSHWQSKDVKAFENKVDTYCHDTVYSMARAAHILSIQHSYSSLHTVTIQHGYSSSHTVTIQHGYSSPHTVTIQHGYNSPNTVTIQHGYSSSHTVTIQHGHSSSHTVTIQHGYSSPHTVTIQHGYSSPHTVNTA
jgi:hypothetical protein